MQNKYNKLIKALYIYFCIGGGNYRQMQVGGRGPCLPKCIHCPSATLFLLQKTPVPAVVRNVGPPPPAGGASTLDTTHNITNNNSLNSFLTNT